MSQEKLTWAQDEFSNGMVARFGLIGGQRDAVLARGCDVAVTAGAGSGKTRTLVARYLPLLAEYRDPRAVVAITFTDKAAREMRSRVRAEAHKLALESEGEARALWAGIEERLDAARISTIHSLCQEILRSHPVEAGLDPQFEVLDETETGLLRRQAVHDALTHAVGDAKYLPLFAVWKINSLEELLNQLVGNRLDMDSAEVGQTVSESAAAYLRSWLASGEVSRALDELRGWQRSGDLRRAIDAGDKAGENAVQFLAEMDQLRASLDASEVIPALEILRSARKGSLGGSAGKKDKIKDCLVGVRKEFDSFFKKLNLEKLADADLEARFAAAQPLLLRLYRAACDRYLLALRQRGALDFDDLEGRALALLEMPGVAARWQAEIHALLVDEFQDTNDRQYRICRALCGPRPGVLFVVGDARQSIYRFRRADVTVFRGLQERMTRSGDLCLELDTTFRAHAGLLDTLDGLLGGAMGRDPQPGRPYYVPFSPVNAHRTAESARCAAPFVEFVIGEGQDAEEGRVSSAAALAERLHELKAAGQIHAWSEVTLLFRASTGFPPYEDALEEAGIPYVTVAGRGFYDRPEVRDVLNMLRSLADPWDDSALTGLLCSPVFGVSRLSLAKMRWKDGHRQPLYAGLFQAAGLGLPEEQLRAIERAADFLRELSPLVDRVPVADLLARVIDATNYRAVLAGRSSRRWRNLDKLLADARGSGAVRVGAFLEYLGSLKDVGAREGEAPAEAEGAVRLMTIHKSKGLEFDVVVLADAARSGNHRANSFYLLPGQPLAVNPDRFDDQPLSYLFAKMLDEDQSEAESLRLLYVALTRASEKLLICGHVTHKEKISVKGWLENLLKAAGLSVDEELLATGGLSVRRQYGVYCAPAARLRQAAEPEEFAWPADEGQPLFPPLVVPAVEREEEELVAPNWRVTGLDEDFHGKVIGCMVHKAVQRWVFPGDPRLPALLDSTAREMGVVQSARREEFSRRAVELLNRFRAHSLWRALDGALERRHEVPYHLQRPNGQIESGCIDLLYRTPAGWQIVDFKTNTIHCHEDFEQLKEKYSRQLSRYARAVRLLLGPVAGCDLFFFDNCGEAILTKVI